MDTDLTRKRFLFVLPVWGGTEEEPITTIRELLRNPQAHFFREVTLKRDVIQVLSKETAKDNLVYPAYFSTNPNPTGPGDSSQKGPRDFQLCLSSHSTVQP